MLCPYCQTENRDDREDCYYCQKDLSMLRLIVNKAKHHYNQGLEYAERNRPEEALKELAEAIDLDQTLVNAHLVMGTLYAQGDDFENAEQCWQRALEQDPNMQKAHDYLSKVESVKQALPAVRRFQFMAGVFGILLIVTVVTLFYISRPDPQAEAARQGLTAVQEAGSASKAAERLQTLLVDEQLPGNSRKALETLAAYLSASGKTGAPATMVHTQDGATDADEKLLELWSRSVDMALIEGEPVLALKMLEQFELVGLDGEAHAQFDRYRAQAREGFQGQLQVLGDRYFAREVEYATLKEAADLFLVMFPEGEDAEQVSELAQRAKTDHLNISFAEARVAVEAAADLTQVLAIVADYEGRDPELAAPLGKLVDERLSQTSQQLERETQQLLEAGQLDVVEDQLAKLRDVYTKAEREAPETLLSGLEAQLTEARLARAQASAERAYENKQWLEYLELTEDVERLAESDVQQRALESRRQRARENWSREQWTWYLGLDPKFADLRISTDEAAEAIDLHEQAIDWLPQDLKYARGPILFYTSASYLKLGEAERARELLEQVKREHPRSFIIASIKKFEKMFAERLPDPQP